MLYVIDHNDSFTYNLVAQIQKYKEVRVVNEAQIQSISWADAQVEGIVLSPGPKSPKDYPNTLELIERFYQLVPIIGVCLGHQMLAYYFGGEIVKGEKPIQGYVHEIMFKNDEPIFKQMSAPLLMTRYHSLHVQHLPKSLVAIAWSHDGVIQMMRHMELPIYSVQFHPESCGSLNGDVLMYNMLRVVNLCD